MSKMNVLTNCSLLAEVSHDERLLLAGKTNLQASNKTESVQHCMQLFMMLLLELTNFKLQKNFSVKR